MVELAVSIFVLTLAILGTLAAIASSANLRQTSRETEVITQLLQHKLEEYRALGNRQAAIARAIADGTPATFSLVMDLDGNGVIESPNSSGQDEAIVQPSDLLPRATGRVFVLDEAEASAAFVTSNAAALPYDLDGDAAAGEVGLNADAGIPAGWTAGACDIDDYSIIPLRFVITWPNTSGGGRDTRTMDAFTLLRSAGATE